MSRLTKPRLTHQQKALRRLARRAGKKALRHLHCALHPVFDDDFEVFSATMLSYAREAARLAIASTEAKVQQAVPPD